MVKLSSKGWLNVSTIANDKPMANEIGSNRLNGTIDKAKRDEINEAIRKKARNPDSVFFL